MFFPHANPRQVNAPPGLAHRTGMDALPELLQQFDGRAFFGQRQPAHQLGDHSGVFRENFAEQLSSFRRHFGENDAAIVHEAARLEGASELRILKDIMVPLALPVLATFSLISFVGHWNDYFWPLVVTSDDSVRTLPIGLARMSDYESGSNWNVVMAANVFLVAPVIFVFLLVRRQLVSAFVTTDSK